jgi:adenylosuccinate synthase
MNTFLEKLGQNVAIVGTQWGDEGKGKLVDAISPSFDIVARSAGGANAGHTIVVDGKQFIFHSLPSSMLHPQVTAVIGNGTVVSVPDLIEEIEELEKNGLSVKNRTKLSLSAHLIFDYHKKIDQELERHKGDKKIGTTGRGIGPAYTDKIARIGIRCEDLLDKDLLQEKLKRNCIFHNQNMGLDLNPDEEFQKILPHIDRIKPFLTNTPKFLQDAHRSGKRILFEGAQGHHLDIDHGTYPFVTSSNTSVGGMCTGLGVGPKAVSSVIGITKAYTTRVGEGPFPSELHDTMGDQLRKTGHEFGSTTGRPRRCGWFDAVLVRNAIFTSSIDTLNITKLDTLSGLPEIKIATRYFLEETELFTVPTTRKAQEKLRLEYETMPGWDDDISNIRSFEALPENAKKYILRLEELLEIPIGCIGVGPDRKALIWR